MTCKNAIQLNKQFLDKATITSTWSIVEMTRLPTETSHCEPISAWVQTEHRSATAVDCITASPLSSSAPLCDGSNGTRLDNAERRVGHTGYDSFTADFTCCQHEDNSPENNKKSTAISKQKALTRCHTDQFSTNNLTNHQQAGRYLFTVSNLDHALAIVSLSHH